MFHIQGLLASGLVLLQPKVTPVFMHTQRHHRWCDGIGIAHHQHFANSLQICNSAISQLQKNTALLQIAEMPINILLAGIFSICRRAMPS